jgi:hypothetical protein
MRNTCRAEWPGEISLDAYRGLPFLAWTQSGEQSPVLLEQNSGPTASGAKRPFMRRVATTKLAVDRQFEHG